MNNDLERRQRGLTKGLRSIWINWTFPLAMIIIAIIIAPVTSKTMMPLVLYALTIGLFALIRYNRQRKEPLCFKIPYINALILFWSATLFVIFNILKVIHAKYGWNGQPYNQEMPYIPILIIAPIGIIVTSWFLFIGKKCAFCRDCEARTGQTVERGFLGRIFTQEAAYQEWFMLIMWSILTVVEWGYYFYIYININLNITDRFFYIWMPAAVYGLTLIYMGIRYYTMWVYYMEHGLNGTNEHDGFSRVRFLVICEDKMWLHIPDPTTDDITPDNILIDTPVRTTVPFTTSLNSVEAFYWFKQITGITNAEIKHLYTSSDTRSVNNIFHFAAYLNSFSDVNNSSVKGEWFNLGKIQSLHQMKLISNLLEAELDRIHRVVMAWKTYSPDGKRLYAIKHYQPTFRLNDMRKWDVNYNDSKWLLIEMNNEDKPFYRLRKIWRNYITGLGK